MTVRIAIAQLSVRVGDIRGNQAAIAKAIGIATDACADLVLTPEMAITGYPCEDLLAEPAFITAAQDATAALAEQVRGTVAIVGGPWRSTDLPEAGGARGQGWSADIAPRALRNAAAVLHHGRIARAHAKTLLPTYSVFDDARHFAAGTRNQSLYRIQTATGPIIVAILICEDVWDPELARAAAADGAQVIVVLNASPFHVGKPAQRLAQVREAAVQAHVPIAYCQGVGGQDDLIFDGGSFVVDADGALLARSPQFTTDHLIVDVPVAPAPRINRAVVDLGTTHRQRTPLPPALVAPDLDVHEEVFEALVTGFRDYCQRTGLTNVILGLSGGIDSALAAVIARDALGPDAVWGIGMPGPYSSPGSVDDARTLAVNLGIRFDVVQIKDPFLERTQALAGLVEQRSGGPGDPVAWENLQARLRGVTLMTLANSIGAIVITTGNRSESAVGYFTLYGDSCGSLAPIGDLFKTSVTTREGTVLPGVYELSRWRNAQEVAAGGIDLIPAATLTKPASAELAPGQQDSDSLPPYEVLDPLLLAFLEERATADELVDQLVSTGSDPSAAVVTVNRILALVDRAEFKRRQVAFRIKVSRVSFGRDRRMPIANHWAHANAPVPVPV